MEKMIYALLSVKRTPEKLNSLLVGMKGISGEGLHAVFFKTISAVVSDINKADLIGDRYTAIEYAEVIDTLADHFTLLPMRFGSVMQSTVAIADMLERNYTEIQHNLQKVDNKCEFGLKVFCDPEKIRAEVIAKSGSGIVLSNKPAPETGNSVFRDYVNRKLAEHRLEESRLKNVESVIAEIILPLARLNSDNQFKKMVSPTTIIDAVFLLEKNKKGELIQAVEDLQSHFAGLNFVLTGPWPPYNFVDFAVR
jgi:hypothetical protein